MKKIALKSLFFVVAVLGATSCSTETTQEEVSSLNATASVFEGQDIKPADLIGVWSIQEMEADIAVDLNQDGTSTTDMLSETTCFDPMYFDFSANGGVATEQARISFPDGKLVCDGIGFYTATYSVSGNTLTVNAEIDGQAVTFTKTIGLSSDADGEYLHVALEDYEVDQFVSDPGNTVVSDVQRIEITYKRQ